MKKNWQSNYRTINELYRFVTHIIYQHTLHHALNSNGVTKKKMVETSSSTSNHLSIKSIQNQ